MLKYQITIMCSKIIISCQERCDLFLFFFLKSGAQGNYIERLEINYI